MSLKRFGGEYRNRTGVHGFAIRCVTTPPTRHPWCRAGPESGAYMGGNRERCKPFFGLWVMQNGGGAGRDGVVRPCVAANTLEKPGRGVAQGAVLWQERASRV